MLRKFVLPPILAFALLFASSRPAGAYSVLTHEEIVDLTWSDSIQPLLLKRFPDLTPLQLQEAHAYAYGGCVIQDLGYYPFSKPIFSDLLHYVRTADFIRALFRDSKDANDVAFAIGALSHFLGDTIGHPAAINLAVGQEFPKLASKYGANVNYAEGPHEHVRAEFAFDVNDIGKHRLAPERYLNRIGFAVPIPLLTKAFYDTYGLDLAKVLGNDHPKLRGYRFSVRSLLPRVAYAEDMLHHKSMPADVSAPELDAFNREIAMLSAGNHWDAYKRRGPRILTRTMAVLIVIIPKFGPLSDLSIRGPSSSSEEKYVSSLMKTVSVMRNTLSTATTSTTIANLDLDTGDPVAPGTYLLEDTTYVDLLHTVTRDPSQPVPFGIKGDLLSYFSDLDKVKYIQGDPKAIAQVRADLPVLQGISTRAAYPETAFLPQPDEAKPPEAKGQPSSNAPEPPTAPASREKPQ